MLPSKEFLPVLIPDCEVVASDGVDDVVDDSDDADEDDEVVGAGETDSDSSYAPKGRG